MTNRTRLSASAAVIALVAVALPLAGGTASAETVKTHDKDVVFDAQHECTGENVSGDTTVKMTITTTENDDGTTTVHTHQKTHGQQLEGFPSLDQYTFNGAEDVETTETLLGPSGTSSIKTIFIHNGEGPVGTAVGSLEGMDDFHLRQDLIISPILPPTMVRDSEECK